MRSEHQAQALIHADMLSSQTCINTLKRIQFQQLTHRISGRDRESVAETPMSARTPTSARTPHKHAHKHSSGPGLNQQGAVGHTTGSTLTMEDRIRMERMARMLAKECAKKVSKDRTCMVCVQGVREGSASRCVCPSTIEMPQPLSPCVQVYVSIYAEGPMRVLCFAEEKTSITSIDDVNSVLNMAIRCVIGGACLCVLCYFVCVVCAFTGVRGGDCQKAFVLCHQVGVSFKNLKTHVSFLGAWLHLPAGCSTCL